MTTDMRNSILLWAGSLAFFGFFWATLHFNLVPDIPERWFWPLLGLIVGVNVLRSVWDHVRKRKASAR